MVYDTFSSPSVHRSSQSVSDFSPEATTQPSHRRTVSYQEKDSEETPKEIDDGIFGNKLYRSGSLLDGLGSKSFLSGINTAKSTIQPIGRHISSLTMRTRPKSSASYDDILNETVQTLKEKCLILSQSLDVKSTYASKLELSLKKVEEKLLIANQEIDKIQDAKASAEREMLDIKADAALYKESVTKDLQERLNEKESEIMTLNDSLQKIKSTISSLINDYQNQLTKTRLELNETKEQLKNHKSLLDNQNQLKNHLELKTSEIFRLESKVSDMREQHQTDIKVIEEQLNLLLEQVKEGEVSKKLEISKLENDHAKAIEQLNQQLSKETSNQKIKMKALDEKIHNLEQEAIVLRTKAEKSLTPDQVSQIQANLQLQNQRASELEDNLKESQAQFTSIVQEHSDIVSKLETELLDYQKNQEQFIQEIEQSRHAIEKMKDDHQKEIDDLSQAIELRLEAKYKDIIASQLKEIEIKGTKEAHLQAQIEELSSKLESNIIDNDSLTLEDFEALQKNYSEALSHAEILAQRLELAQSVAAKNSETLIKEKDHIRNQFQKLQTRNQSLLREKGELAQELDELKTKYAHHPR